MTTIAMPESLNFLANPAHFAALKRIGNADGLPAGLTMDEAREFHLAKLSALKLRTDYWCLLHDLWRATWGPLVSTLQPVPFGTSDWDEGAGEVDEVWEYKTICASHKLEHGAYPWTAVSLEPGAQTLKLMFFVEDKAGKRDADWLAMTPPSGWVLKGADKGDFTPCWLAEITVESHAGGIDPTAAAALARAAMTPFLTTAR